MRNLVIIFTIVAFGASISTASDPVIESTTLISTTIVQLSLDNMDQYDHFQTVDFNKDSNSIDVKTKEQIKYIQIFNEKDELQYQLPVMSNKVKISKDIFDKGAYKIGFVLENLREIQFTNLQVNE